MLWQIDDGQLVLSCRKSSFPSSLLNVTIWSKRAIFAAAGCASTGSDPLYQHAETRALGDLLRRIAGSKSSKLDGLLPLTVKESVVVTSCLKRLQNLLLEPCAHSVARSPPNVLECCADASSTGGA